VRQEDIQRLRQAQQAVHFQLAHMVRAAHAARVVRRALKVALQGRGEGAWGGDRYVLGCSGSPR
jgi:hypothetical protein